MLKLQKNNCFSKFPTINHSIMSKQLTVPRLLRLLDNSHSLNLDICPMLNRLFYTWYQFFMKSISAKYQSRHEILAEDLSQILEGY